MFDCLNNCMVKLGFKRENKLAADLVWYPYSVGEKRFGFTL